jgi:hypothetical protein
VFQNDGILEHPSISRFKSHQEHQKFDRPILQKNHFCRREMPLRSLKRYVRADVESNLLMDRDFLRKAKTAGGLHPGGCALMHDRIEQCFTATGVLKLQ